MDRTASVCVPEERWRATYGAFAGEKKKSEVWRVRGDGGVAAGLDGKGVVVGGGGMRREELLRNRERWMREREEKKKREGRKGREF